MTIHTWQLGMYERPCGSCTMCCKLPAAPAPLNKPAGVWCQHCIKGSGCKIYDSRPQGCRDFYCLWKVMPDFPEELRPDKCKVIWQMTEDGKTVIALTEYPGVLEKQSQRWLRSQFEKIGVKVVVREPAA